MAKIKTYIIHRLEDDVDLEKGSDDGPIWDRYGIRSKHRRFYVNKFAATMIAFWMNENTDAVWTVSDGPEIERE